MSNFASEPLTKVSLNLYTEDINRLRSKFSDGWSKEVREWVRQRLRQMDRRSDEMRGVCGNE